MPSKRLNRPPFDARHKFVVTPPGGRTHIFVGGRAFAHGDEMDKTLVTPRRLRQMYESSRVIAVAPGSTLPAAPARRPGSIGSSTILPPDAQTPPVQAESTKKVRARAVPRRRLEHAAPAA